ncbi:hypothetical protein HMPREF0083_03485 [Aneurinibacillus aneurinilyticus ATCC 12856]|uniref:Uncharacterized protein n=1 Tax=Aneurinibacillus aneurinilyticus ATCC 12856 TaxID=649747 RepID=U1X0C8_ANEAE|nr:hypothetical protein HMPREF0083_03485 [Aneurinibacillus aneurinilyticus ATCC 12856]
MYIVSIVNLSAIFKATRTYGLIQSNGYKCCSHGAAFFIEWKSGIF